MRIDALVAPRSVAIVGATDRPSPSRSLIEALAGIGFAGPIYPVNPKYQTVLNRVCYPTLLDLPEAPDIVVLSVRNPLVPEQIRLAAKRGARSAVIYDSGFAELFLAHQFSPFPLHRRPPATDWYVDPQNIR